MKILDVLNAPWAIVPEKLHEITEVYARHVRGEKVDVKGITAQVDAAVAAAGESRKAERPYEVIDAVAVLAFDGIVAKKMNLFSLISGGISTQLFARDFRRALADPEVGSVVLAIDSPGGTVDGTQELARVIMEARAGDKPVVSWVDGMMASAAYWIGSAADAIFTGAGTDQVGSIGVVTQHVDYSKFEERIGIETTEIYAGKYKRIASQHAPLSKEGKAYLQEEVDYLYSLFVDAVAAQRAVPTEQVLAGMADGRIFIGQQAIDAGLVDGASTLEALIGELAAGGYHPRRSGAVQSRATGAGAVSPGRAASNNDDAGVASKSTHQAEDDMELTREMLERDQPEIAKAIRDEGYAAGVEAGTRSGADAERTRILDVEAQCLPGHEKLIARLKADGKTSGAEAAVQILAAEKAAGAAKEEALQLDAPKPAPASASSTGEADEEAGLSAEEKAGKRWEKDEALRAEYGGNRESWLAYAKAEAAGRVKTLGKKAA